MASSNQSLGAMSVVLGVLFLLNGFYYFCLTQPRPEAERINQYRDSHNRLSCAVTEESAHSVASVQQVIELNDHYMILHRIIIYVIAG